MAIRCGAPWSEADDAILRQGYPDYIGLSRRLPHRSLAALKHRVRKLGIAQARHVWTNREVARLRQLYAQNTRDRELVSHFPGLRLVQIKSKADHLGLAVRRRTLRRLGVPPLDDLRQAAAKRGWSLVELDRQARTGRYFQSCTRRLKLKAIARAACVLGQTITIRWHDDEPY